MTNERKMAPHVAAAVRQTATALPVQAKVHPAARLPSRPQPPQSHVVDVLQMARRKKKGKQKNDDSARDDARRVLGDFQAYGTQQYGQRLWQLMGAANCTEKRAMELMIQWIMAHETWSHKKIWGTSRSGQGHRCILKPSGRST